MSLHSLHSTVTQSSGAAIANKAGKPASMGVMNFFDLLLGKGNIGSGLWSQMQTKSGGGELKAAVADFLTPASGTPIEMGTQGLIISGARASDTQGLSMEMRSFLKSLLQLLQKQAQDGAAATKSSQNLQIMDSAAADSSTMQALADFATALKQILDNANSAKIQDVQKLLQKMMAENPSPEISALISANLQLILPSDLTQTAGIFDKMKTDNNLLSNAQDQDSALAAKHLTATMILDKDLPDGALDLEIEKKAQSFSNLLKKLLGDDSEGGKNFLLKVKASQNQNAAPDVLQKILPSLRPEASSFSLFSSYVLGGLDDLFSSTELNRMSMTGLGAYVAQPAAANIMVQAPSAGAPHPGTAIIAALLRKLPGGGEARTFNVQLDPPELGRVEIRLDFARNKAMKVHVIAEKAETYLMLQRDGQILERALQENGMSLESENGLSFSFAGDGQDFSQNGRHNGQGPMARGKDSEEEEIVINSTMTWQVDPATGHVHYSIWV